MVDIAKKISLLWSYLVLRALAVWNRTRWKKKSFVEAITYISDTYVMYAILNFLLTTQC